MFLSITSQPDLGWMRRLQQILGRKHQRNLHVCTAFLAVLIRKNIFATLVWSLDVLYVGIICSSPNIWTEGCDICSAVACRQCGKSETYILLIKFWKLYILLGFFVRFLVVFLMWKAIFRYGRKWYTLIDFCSCSDMFLVSSWPFPTLYFSWVFLFNFPPPPQKEKIIIVVFFNYLMGTTWWVGFWYTTIMIHIGIPHSVINYGCPGQWLNGCTSNPFLFTTFVACVATRMPFLVYIIIIICNSFKFHVILMF